MNRYKQILMLSCSSGYLIHFPISFEGKSPKLRHFQVLSPTCLKIDAHLKFSTHLLLATAD